MPSLPLPEPLHIWPPSVTAGLWVRVLRMITTALQTRATYDSPEPVGLTCWPNENITFEDYNRWRSEGDRQRRTVTDRDKGGLTDEERARRKTQREARSRHMRETHEAVCTALVTVSVGGWDLLLLEHQEGIHIALDVLDGVRCRTTAGFIVEYGDRPVLASSQHLASSDLATVRGLALGTEPDHLNGLGHSGMGELLSIASNYLASWTYLQQPTAPDPRSQAGAAILRQRVPHALLYDNQTVKAAMLLRQAVDERRREAEARRIYYSRSRPTQLPASHRYA